MGSKHGKTPRGSSFSLPYWLKVSHKIGFYLIASFFSIYPF
ncbi:hypothetical protein C789_1444 [Microcystis aeruginosa FACHB-905 = DIANCHI905]|uniref:Uncharacterized protein n=1 Tax=Microcystis aeruginosa PCC 7806SL TaxID=1903187 RepID=A0AB33BNN2_MICA7|nr:hypothetical protein BH695_2625 [Microcystis aeruginosa PCC 7806SL]ELS48753.1 hypothetical protein C789_1444 [Microcystis aeruginosa FACHB-905 = DIANCHI905]